MILSSCIFLVVAATAKLMQIRIELQLRRDYKHNLIRWHGIMDMCFVIGTLGALICFFNYLTEL